MLAAGHLAPAPTTKLNNGTAIPSVGLGVFESSPADCYAACLAALKRGYRHIDTAAYYHNESDVGRAIRDSGVPRDEIWITTKLWLEDGAKPGDATDVFQKSARALSGDDAYDARKDRTGAAGHYAVDLYLIHAPFPGIRLDAWREMEELLKKGHVRALGVSNYGPQHIDELLKHCTIKPAVNQVELHPFYQRRALVAKCLSHGISIEAYSPLTRGKNMQHPAIRAVADRVGKSPAQVLVRWSIQKGFIPLPKTVNPARLDENRDVFGWELAQRDMEELDALDAGTSLIPGWDPTLWA
ncbi:NADP-dependent oxidoreductase domain-containing protein [Zopfochytrium polystomum]|nr:NADP-dependent oxidoreductase domain-containing protein [Zopfochytrium polystomum]